MTTIRQKAWEYAKRSPMRKGTLGYDLVEAAFLAGARAMRDLAEAHFTDPDDWSLPESRVRARIRALLPDEEVK